MRANAKMLLMRSNQGNDNGRSGRSNERSNYGRNEYDVGYEMESRFRDSRGREHYDNGRYAPMRNYSESDILVGNRQNYDVGNYGAGRNNRRNRRNRNEYEEDRYRREQQPMGTIGFEIGSNHEQWPQEYRPDFQAEAGYHNMDEMGYRQGGQQQKGYAYGMEQQPLSKQTAMEWARHMQNEDGSTGPHWTLDQAKQVMAQKGVECEPLEFWIALNMMYSDYCKVFRKYGVGDKIDFYVDMAKAFLDDTDSVEDKLEAYYAYVVRH